MTRKVLTSFYAETDDSILVNAKTILSSMTDNPNFVTPVPTLADVAVVLEEYVNALVKARQTQSTQDVEIKNIDKARLQNLLSKLAIYVNLTADGNLVKLESSGFQLNKEPHTHGILEAPHAISLSSIHAGQVEIKIDKVANASGYLVMYKEISEETWSSALLSKTSGTIKNLKSVARYEFKVAATSSASNAANEYNYSQIANIVVQ